MRKNAENSAKFSRFLAFKILDFPHPRYVFRYKLKNLYVTTPTRPTRPISSKTENKRICTYTVLDP